MRKCLVSDVLADFGTRRWRRIPLRARQLHQTSRDTSRPCAHSSDIAMPRHLPISTPRLFDIPTVRLHLDTSAVTGCEIGLAGVLGRACHSVASSAPSSCHSVASSGDNLLASCGFVRFRATRWRRVHRLRATRWRRVAIICLPTAVLSAFAPLGGVECIVSAPLGGVEWRDRYVPRAPLRRSMASRISCRVTTRKTVKSRSTQDLPDGLRYYVT